MSDQGSQEDQEFRVVRLTEISIRVGDHTQRKADILRVVSVSE